MGVVHNLTKNFLRRPVFQCGERIVAVFGLLFLNLGPFVGVGLAHGWERAPVFGCARCDVPDLLGMSFKSSISAVLLLSASLSTLLFGYTLVARCSSPLQRWSDLAGYDLPAQGTAQRDWSRGKPSLPRVDSKTLGGRPKPVRTACLARRHRPARIFRTDRWTLCFFFASRFSAARRWNCGRHRCRALQVLLLQQARVLPASRNARSAPPQDDLGRRRSLIRPHRFESAALPVDERRPPARDRLGIGRRLRSQSQESALRPDRRVGRYAGTASRSRKAGQRTRPTVVRRPALT